MTISFRAFADELVKIAKDEEERLYAPGIVAHEAGHAKVHGPTARDMALQYGRFGGGLALNIIAGRVSPTKSNRDKVLAGALALDAAQLGDEYASTIMGLKELKDQGKLSKGQRAHETVRQVAAGTTYAATPASRLLSVIEDPKVKTRVAKGIAAGALVGTLGATTHTGPKITAREAKELVHSIAPDVDVYASKKPISAGSMYVNKSYTPIGKGLVYLTTRALGMSSEDAKNIANKGGVIVAPVTPVANLGLGLAHEALSSAVRQGASGIAGPIAASMIPVPHLTLPGAKIRKVE